MDGEHILYADSLMPNDFYAVKTWNFAQTPENFRMEFAGADSPEFYAFAMDGLSGVAVDNVALRGCSGTIFVKMNGVHLGSMYRDLNVKCIILQFGGNAIPGLNEDNVGAFNNYFAAQIRFLRRICPGVSIIVIGPADMSIKVEDRYETYPILPTVVELLKSAALQNDCAYWDMYEAMGGLNTMPDWVFHDPPLAEKDFVHFNPAGANAIAKMFYNALITRYNEYIAARK
jgi:lysophospholipase L1-like esterase